MDTFRIYRRNLRRLQPSSARSLPVSACAMWRSAARGEPTSSTSMPANWARCERPSTEYGLKVSSIGSPIGKISIDDEFPPHLERMRHAVEVAKTLEAPYIRIFSFFIPEGTDPDSRRDEVLSRMSALAEVAADADVILVHENEKEIYGDIPRRCLDIVTSVSAPQLQLAWDPANFVQVGVRPFTEGYAMLRPHVGYIQIKDALLADGTVVVAGAGDGEVRRDGPRTARRRFRRLLLPGAAPR